MDTEMTPLNAVVDPILIRAKMHAMMLVKATAFTGIDVLLLIYFFVNAAHSLSDECFHLAQLAPARKTLIPCECPANARS